MRVWTAAQLFNMHFDGAENEMQVVAEPLCLLAVDDARVWINMYGAAIGGLNDGFRLCVRYEFVPDTDSRIHGQSPNLDPCPFQRQASRDASDPALPGYRCLPHGGVAR